MVRAAKRQRALRIALVDPPIRYRGAVGRNTERRRDFHQTRLLWHAWQYCVLNRFYRQHVVKDSIAADRGDDPAVSWVAATGRAQSDRCIA
jgi:hypothetical protein